MVFAEYGVREPTWSIRYPKPDIMPGSIGEVGTVLCGSDIQDVRYCELVFILCETLILSTHYRQSDIVAHLPQVLI
jgi:hypothetical protein